MRKTKTIGTVLAAAGLLALAACDEDSGVACTMNYAYGITLYVHDSATGANIVTGATGIAVAGTFRDSVTVPAGTTGSVPFIPLAGERAGTYTVTARRAGYRDWTRTGVVVTRDVCHVHPVSITALLQQAP